VRGREHRRLLPGRAACSARSRRTVSTDRTDDPQPLPAAERQPAAGQNYNYEVAAPTTENLTQQPSIRVDYQLSQKLRVDRQVLGQRARKLITPGTIQGFNDMQNPYPFITNYGATVDYQINNSTFLEGTYGFIRNQLAGGGSIGSPGVRRVPAASRQRLGEPARPAFRASRCSTRARACRPALRTRTAC
jgi:hypothetical protein